MPLDDMVGHVAGPLAVKIDTQGAEPFVIAGGAKTLASVELLILEFCPYMIERMGGDSERVLSFLETKFRTLCLAHREEEACAPAMPATGVTSMLRQVVAERKRDASCYFDAFAQVGGSGVSAALVGRATDLADSLRLKAKTTAALSRAIAGLAESNHSSSPIR
jgi:hypothetical protein